MSRGRKTKREMVVLIRKLKRSRALKKTVAKNFSKPVEEAAAVSK